VQYVIRRFRPKRFVDKKVDAVGSGINFICIIDKLVMSANKLKRLDFGNLERRSGVLSQGRQCVIYDGNDYR